MAAVLPLLLLILALYFVILPQRRRAQAQRNLQGALAPGDRVVTAGGMIGTLRSIDGERGFVEVADGVVLELLAAAIVRRLADPADDVDDEADAVLDHDGDHGDDEHDDHGDHDHDVAAITDDGHHVGYPIDDHPATAGPNQTVAPSTPTDDPDVPEGAGPEES